MSTTKSTTDWLPAGELEAPARLTGRLRYHRTATIQSFLPAGPLVSVARPRAGYTQLTVSGAEPAVVCFDALVEISDAA
jgi:hypothetical protein